MLDIEKIVIGNIKRDDEKYISHKRVRNDYLKFVKIKNLVKHRRWLG